VLILLLGSVAGAYAYYQYSSQSNRWYKSYFGGKPTAEEVMANYYKVAGEGTQSEQTSMKIKGTVKKDEEPINFSAGYISDEKLNTHMGPVEMQVTAKFPNKFRLEANSSIVRKKMDRPDDVRNFYMIRAFDGKQGWTSEPSPQGNLVSVMDPRKVDDLQNDLSLKYMSLLSRYASVRMLKEEKGEGFEKGKQKDFYVLQGVSIRGTLERLYFDVETGLLECTLVETVVGGAGTQRTCFSDYRDVQGVKLPFKSRLDSSQFHGTMEINSFELNPPVDESIFAKP
jgi:hypothetical protein